MHRRSLLKAGVAGLAGYGFVGRGAAVEEHRWEYSPVSAAPVPGTTDSWVHNGWAYVANLEGMTTFDISDPSSPAFGGHARGGSSTHDNRDVKVAEPSQGDPERIASLADNGDPGGVTFYDVSDPASPTQLSFYDAASGVHNHDIDGDYAYLSIIASGDASFSDTRLDVVDIRDPANPQHVTFWWLKDFREDMSQAGTNPLHDVYVQDGYAYMSFWKAGTIVADITDPENPRPVAHFAAHEEATKPESDDTAEYYRDYAGDPENAHTTKPTPDREYTFVGTESFAEPTGTALSSTHGGVRIFHTPALTCEPHQLDSIDPLAGKVDGEGGSMNPRTKTHRADPFAPAYLDLIRAPDNPHDVVRTAHNLTLTNDKAFTSWYQAGIRAYDFSSFRDGDPHVGELVQLAAFDLPGGDFYWNALNLETTTDDVIDDDTRFYTVGSDTGDGLHILELARMDG